MEGRNKASASTLSEVVGSATRAKKLDMSAVISDMQSHQAEIKPAQKNWGQSWDDFNKRTTGGYASKIAYGIVDGIWTFSSSIKNGWRDASNIRGEGIISTYGAAAAEKMRMQSAISTIGLMTPIRFEGGKGISFWSGLGTEASAIADGFQTLGQTRAGQNLIKLTEGMPYYPAINGQPASQAYQWWARLSTQAAKSASGTVHVYQLPLQQVDNLSIWRLHEYPTLKANPNVTKIIFHY